MRTILAACLLMVTGVAFGQTTCPLCTPGTTPATYRITFAGTSNAALNGRTFAMTYLGRNLWTTTSPTAFGGEQLTFFHAGYNPTNKTFCGHPGKGLIVGANHAGLIGFGDWVDFVPTAGERDGNGPFVLPLKIGGTATVQP